MKACFWKRFAMRTCQDHLAIEAFGYAESWDEKRGRYAGLKAGQTISVLIDGQSVLVKPDVAAAQLAADQATSTPVLDTGVKQVKGNEEGKTALDDQKPGPGPVPQPEVKKAQLQRFHGTVRLDALRVGRDASRIGEEIIQHLAGIVGADIEITLEIQCDLPEGASDKLVRDVTENCRTLEL